MGAFMRLCAFVGVLDHLYLSVQMWVYRLIPDSLGTALIDSSILGCHGDDDGCVLGCHGDHCLGILSACII